MSAAEPPSFSLFTSIRHDPVLLSSPENSSDTVSFSPTGSPFYMLRLHRDRMLEAAHHFTMPAVAAALADGPALESLLTTHVTTWLTTTSTPASTPLKVRILFSPTGALHTDLAPTPPLPLSALYPRSLPKPLIPSSKTGGALLKGPDDVSWLLTLDSAPTLPSPHTSLKTTLRAPYDAARARAPAPTTKEGQLHEVLLWNAVDEMTEGSFTSVYFWRGGRWVTPPVGAPVPLDDGAAGGVQDEGELREPFAGRWGHSVRSVKGGGGQRGTTRRWALREGLCMEEPVGKGTVGVGEEVWVSNGVRGFGRGRVVG